MHYIEDNASPTAVFLKTDKIDGNCFCQIRPMHCSLSNRSFDYGEETNTCPHFAVLVEFFRPEILLISIEFVNIYQI